MAYKPRFMSGTTLVVALALLLAVGVFAFYGSSEKEIVNEPDNTKVVQKELASVASTAKKDSDGDGLADWEEVLWKTDKENPDTDGDGTPDGEEVRADRNPLVAGPDDLLSKKTDDSLIKVTQPSKSPEEITKTDALARTLFSKYVSLKRISGNLDGENTSAIVNLLSDMVNETLPDRFAVSDLLIEDFGDIKEYGNAVADAFSKNKIENENELVILQRALDAKNPDGLKKLNDTVISYKNTINDLLVIRVPERAVSVHLALINSMDKTTRSIEGMKLVFDDPVAALSAIENYPKYAENFLASITSVGKFLKKNGAEYSPNESGFSLTQTI